MNQRTIPWGTVLAGSLALSLAVLVGLTEIAGVSVPIRSAGPGAVLVVGVLILLVGLVAVLRSNRRAALARAAHPTGPPTSALAASPAPLPSPIAPAAAPPTSELDPLIAPEPDSSAPGTEQASAATTPIPSEPQAGPSH